MHNPLNTYLEKKKKEEEGNYVKSNFSRYKNLAFPSMIS